MFRRISLLPAVLCLTAFATADTRSLSLGEALNMVADTNLNVLIGREAVVQSVEQLAQSRSGLLPQVTFDAAQRRNLSAQVGANVVRSGVNNRFDMQLNGRLDLLNPVNLARYKAAQIAVTVSELGEAAVRQTILASVASTYFAHLRNLDRINVLDDNIARARTLLQLARNQLNAGVATQIDVTRAEAQLAVAEQARLQQDTLVQGSELQLKQLLALDIDQPIKLEPFVVRRTAPGIYTSSEADYVYARRPDLQSAQALLEQSQLEVRAAKYGRLPSLALIGSYGYATERAFDGNEAKTWSGSVALSVPVFDGARVRSLTGYARSRQRAQEMRVRDLEYKISAELRLARQDATSRLAQISVAEKGLALGREELELAEKRFAQGVADNREIIEAQARFSAASDNLLEAVYLYNLSRVELARVRGEVRTLLEEDRA